MADERLISKTSGLSEFVFNPHGSRIEKLVINGHEVLGAVERGGGSRATSHPAAPQFDNDTAGFGFERHGPMRGMLAKTFNISTASLRTEVNITRKDYGSIRVSQIYSIHPQFFDINTFVWNMTNKPSPVNYGYHPYYLAPEGRKGTTLNGELMDGTIEEDGIVYWQERNNLLIPGRRLIIEHQGLPVANLWTDKNEAGVFDQHYFTVSAVEGNFRTGFFGSDESRVAANTARHTRLTIALG